MRREDTPQPAMPRDDLEGAPDDAGRRRRRRDAAGRGRPAGAVGATTPSAVAAGAAGAAAAATGAAARATATARKRAIRARRRRRHRRLPANRRHRHDARTAAAHGRAALRRGSTAPAGRREPPRRTRRGAASTVREPAPRFDAGDEAPRSPPQSPPPPTSTVQRRGRCRPAAPRGLVVEARLTLCSCLSSRRRGPACAVARVGRSE